MRYIVIVLFVFMQTLNGYAQESEKDTQTEKFRYVEQMPQPGYDLMQYLSSNIHYPDTAIKSNIQARIIVQFVVTDKGDITEVKTIGNKVYGYGLEEEAIRVVKAMPKWKPGKQNGMPVNVYYTQPITFKLEDDKPAPVKK